MHIPEHKITDIVERVDLVALISRHVELKKSGRNYIGRCPFHQEKTASFNVNPSLNIFKCFGCQAGGDAIAFVQRFLGKTFVDAVTDLAREVGVELEASVDPLAQERQALREVTRLAVEHFRGQLSAPAGERARAYLTERGVTSESIQTFGLGYAPAAWTLLSDRLTASGLLAFGHRAGLVTPRTKGDGYVDIFRGRVIIPIRATDGRPIAFGGRLIDGADGPKYLNSKESPLYTKSDVLFGLDQAKEAIRAARAAVLVEGYFDCIGLHQEGVRHAVALCSTALTPGHLSALKRAEARSVILLLDGDDAGRKAIFRLAGPLLASATPAQVALLPDGEDPDTFARKAGGEGVRALLASAAPLTRHLFTTVLPEGPRSTFEAKLAAVEVLRPIASQLPVGLTRSALFSAMAAHFGLPASELESAVQGQHRAPRPAPKPSAAGPASPVGRAGAPERERPCDALETLYVALLLKDPRLAHADAHRAGDELSHPGLRLLTSRLMSGTSPEDALAEVGTSVRAALERAGAATPSTAELWGPTFLATCRRLKLRRIDEQLSHLTRVTKADPAANELSEETRSLLAERTALLELRRRVLSESTPRGNARLGDHP